MSFLSNIATIGNKTLGAINEQFTPGENTPRSLNSVDPSDPDRTNNFGTLGDFASKIDKTALRSYIETGLIRNVRPHNLEILMQEPEMTVLVKKRIFSSLIDNYRFDLMPAEDKLFIRATKKLFKNKCQAIATYEKLSKIEKIVKNTGILDEFMVPQIISGISALEAAGVNIVDGKTKNVIETLQKVMNLSEPASTTNWNIANDSAFYSEMGEGTGTFDLTVVASMNSTVSTAFGGGMGSLTIEDPYNLMCITEEDIEKALADASSIFNSSNFFRETTDILQKITNDLKAQLNSIRFVRGAANINFLINDDTLLYRRVRAILDEIGQEIFFNYDPGVLGVASSIDVDQGSIDENQQLNKSELKLFISITKNIYELLNQQRATQSQLNDLDDATHEQVNYAREKLTLNHMGKTIIQSMDVIHVFISSKTQVDARVIGFDKASLSGGSLLNALNQSTNNIQNAFNNISGFFGGNTQNTMVDAEKDAIVGADFPTWLWILLKNVFTRQSAGVQVFTGIVDTATSAYSASNGGYTVNVRINDNCKYMQMGEINLKPSVDVFNGPLYDPLTPFKLDFDASTGFELGEFPELLDENKKLLESGLIKFKNGPLRGTIASETLYKTQNGESVQGSSSLNYRMVLNDPDGFIYRWKSGIGSLTTFNDPNPIASINNNISQSLTKNAFAGQDVMNVLSLLITGQPYNYNTFVLAGIQSGNLSKDDILNQDGSVSYYRGLLANLSKNNLTWGNFIPFKHQIVNERALNFLVQGQFDVSTANSKLNDLLQQRANFLDQLSLTATGAQFANNPQVFAINANFAATLPIDQNSVNTPADPASIAAANIIDINKQIATLETDLQNYLSVPNVNNGALKIIGDDISFDPNVSDDSSLTEDQRVRARREFRNKLNYLTQRRLWKVKANEDSNLFIVDDQYDKNYDIQAFEKGLAGKLSLLDSEYTNVGTRIPMVASQLGLEVFADSQGHIRARPPGYNKVPSSVFYKMIRDTISKKKRIFPKILESLFINQVDGTKDQIETNEDQIRYRCALLEFADDSSAEKFLAGGGGNAFNGTGSFVFVTGSDGFLGGKDLRNMFQQANPDIKEGLDYKPLQAISTTISGQLKQNVIFGIQNKITAIQNVSIFSGNTNVLNAGQTRANEIATRLMKKGITVSNPFTTERGTNTSQVQALSVLDEISRFISERQNLLKTLSNSVKNLSDGVAVNTDPTKARALIYPSINTKTSLPDILEHMIEDEDNDDLGPGSGGRYIIHENQILDFQITESPPEFTTVEVHGLFGEGFAQPPNALSLGSGGNAVSTAFATDYDMWRMYGFKQSQAIPAAALSDPDTQLAPLAVFLLNKARKNILKGTCTIVGNEYMQTGEVIYIESKNLLFYVEQVNQSFNYAGTFTTSLTLSYGHAPGEYIPTMLDIVGKALYSKKHNANLVRHVRHGYANGETPITTLITDNDQTKLDLDNLIGGTFGDQNRKNLINMVVAASGILTPNVSKTPVLELRIYYKSNVDQNLVNIANSVKEWIVNPSAKSLGDQLLPDANFSGGIGLDPSNIIVNAIDFTDKSLPQSPSIQSWNLIRNAVDSKPFDFNPAEATQEESVLFHNIIDIWVTFKDVPSTVSTTTSNIGTNQNAISAQEKLETDLGLKNG